MSLNKRVPGFDLITSLFLLSISIFLIQSALLNLDYINKKAVLITSVIYLSIIILEIKDHFTQKRLKHEIWIKAAGLLAAWLCIFYTSNIHEHAFKFLIDVFFIGQIFISIFLIQFIRINNNFIERREQDNKKLEKINFWVPFVFIITINAYYVFFNFAPPSWDPSRHAYNALRVYDLLKGQFSGIQDAFLYYDLYPSLTYIVSVIFIFLFGKSYNSITLSMPLFWLPLAYIFLFKTTSKYLRLTVTKASLLTFTLLSTVFIIAMAKQYMIELPVFTLLIIYIYYLYKSNFLVSGKYTFISGAIFSLGLLTKEIFLLFAVVPLVFAIVRMALKFFKRKDWRLLLRYGENIFLHLLGIISIAGIWYICWVDNYMYEMKGQTINAGYDGDPDPFSFASVIWYPSYLPDMLTIPIVILIVAGFIKIFSAKKHVFFNFMCLVSIILIYMVATSQHNKDHRYIIAILFFVLPGYVAFFHGPTKLKSLNNGVILFFISWAFLNNITQAFDVSLPIPFYNSKGYVIPKEPVAPNNTNTPEAFSAFKLLYLKAYAKDENQLIVKEEFGSFGHLAFSDLSYKYYSYQLGIENKFEIYDSILHKKTAFQTGISYNKNKIKVPIEKLTGHELIFFKDQYYPSYYLFKAKIDSGQFYIEKIGFHGKIKGDLTLDLTFYKNGRSEKIGKNFIDNILVNIPDCDTLSINIKNFHSQGRAPLYIADHFLNQYPFRADVYNSLLPLSDKADKNFNVIFTNIQRP